MLYFFFFFFFLSGCVLEAGKEVVFNPEDDDLEHQLDLRMVSAKFNFCEEEGPLAQEYIDMFLFLMNVFNIYL